MDQTKKIVKSQILTIGDKEVETLPEFECEQVSKNPKDISQAISHIITFKNGNSLYLGNQHGAGVHYNGTTEEVKARDLRRLQTFNIKAIVTCRDIKPMFEGEMEYHIIPMDKDHKAGGYIDEKMRSSYNFIVEKLQTGSVFVHCEHGRTRSATTVAYFLMRYFEADFYTVKEFMLTRRDCVKLHKFEDKLLKLYATDVLKN